MFVSFRKCLGTDTPRTSPFTTPEHTSASYETLKRRYVRLSQNAGNPAQKPQNGGTLGCKKEWVTPLAWLSIFSFSFSFIFLFCSGSGLTQNPEDLIQKRLQHTALPDHIEVEVITNQLSSETLQLCQLKGPHCWVISSCIIFNGLSITTNYQVRLNR